MKKIIFLLTALFALVSCSNDEAESDAKAKDGQYISRNGATVVCVHINGAKCSAITIFSDNKVCFQAIGCVATSGEYPNYTFTYDEWALKSTFSKNAFNATTSGSLTANCNNATGTIALPQSMSFTYDTTILDKNGDGILDSVQDI